MPEIMFIVQLPDGREKSCYSPSSVVRNYFTAGEELPVGEFLQRSRKALAEASNRVHAKFGFHCTSARQSLADIEAFTRPLAPTETVKILRV